jgi:hypothetical protein
MSIKWRIMGFVLTAWTLAAALGGMLGWSGVWGTGSAFVDYLIPFPTTGGMLHVMTLVPAAGLVGLRSAGAEPFSALARPLLLGLVLAGVLLMLNMNDILLALNSDVPMPRGAHLLQANPLGLFALTDGVIAQLWLSRREDVPRSFGAWVAAGIALLAPAAIVGSIAHEQSPTAKYRLLLGASREGESRGDEIVTLYSTMGFAPAELAAEMRTNLSLAMPPEMHETAEDQAVYFFDSLQSARTMDLGAARATWCRYEDGTPSRWHSGSADCFSDHETFAERLERAWRDTDPSLPVDSRQAAARRDACKGVSIAESASFSAVTAQRMCSALSH